MRSTDIRSVPSSGSAVIDFFIGEQGVGAVVVHNASYRVLALTLSNGISVNIAAQRSDLVVIGQATFDGHVTLTPSLLVSSQTDAGSVWLDVYLPGERVVGTYPAPCANAMTGGNQQPRSVAVPIAPGNFTSSVVGLTQNVLTQLDFWDASHASLPINAFGFFSFYLYYAQFMPLLQTATTFQFILTLNVQPQNAANASLGGPFEIWRGGGLAALQGTTFAAVVPAQYQASGTCLVSAVPFSASPANPLDHIAIQVKLLSSTASSYHFFLQWGVDGSNAHFPAGIGETQYATGVKLYVGDTY